MRRRAFALLEILVVIGILGAVVMLTIPLYREYLIRGDLENVTQQVTQGLGRAKVLSQAAQRDSSWGFYVPAGVLYKGTSYATRDTAFDEVYPMPSTIAVNGLFDVAFSKITGIPNATGEIVLRALNNDERIIQVSISVSPQQLATNESDVLTICHRQGTPQTITIPDATWPSHQGHGDTMGPCPAPSSSSSSVAISSSSSSSRSSSSSPLSSSSSVSSGGGGGSSSSSCTKYTMASNQKITLNTQSSVTFKNLLAQLRFGDGGPYVNVHVCYSKNNGSSWQSLFGGSGNCTGNGNAYGNAVEPNGTDTKTMTLASGNQLALKIHGSYQLFGWLSFNETFTSIDQTGHVIFLRNGDVLSNYSNVQNQVPLKQYLTSQGMLNAQGKVVLGQCQILSIGDFNDLGTSGADFQDDVLLMTFN